MGKVLSACWFRSLNEKVYLKFMTAIFSLNIGSDALALCPIKG